MTTIDFSTIPANVPSMCIPRVFKNITRERVIAVFKELDLGIIERVDMISKENEKGDKFQRIFIHLKKWSGSANSNRAREMLLSGKEIKIVYDDPWFWKISANKSTRNGTGTGTGTGTGSRKPSIKFDESPRSRVGKNLIFESRSPQPNFQRSPSPEVQTDSFDSYVTPEKTSSVDYGKVPTMQMHPKKKGILKKTIDKSSAPLQLQISEVEGEGEVCISEN
jgi:hypothetical protein